MFGSSVLIFCFLHFYLRGANGIYEFPKEKYDLDGRVLDLVASIPSEQWISSLNFGSSSVDRKRRLEQNLLRSQITIQNGSISHAQLIDSLPNADVQIESEIALKILKSSIHVHDTICAEQGIDNQQCSYLLSKKQLPENSELGNKCREILSRRRDGNHSFRRLLPRNYKDGFYAMYPSNQPLPREISSKALPSQSIDLETEPLDDELRNLAFVQWSQFIEHDLSKPVVRSMSNGQPIECCNEDSYDLSPRYRHIACAPLIGRDSSMKHAKETCLNYVRSALALGESCTFGPAEQLNQATGYFDLSQLYGYTKAAETRIRSFINGRLKSTHANEVHNELLPICEGSFHNFCANNDTFCFLASDSRVNSSPFSIVIYTLFMRNHNNIAQRLATEYPDWNDEKLFQTAKTINIDIYKNIIFNEYLQEVLGKHLAKKINSEAIIDKINFPDADYRISNEFAVAASRFYFSMMPNSLYNLATTASVENDDKLEIEKNNVLPDPHIFVLSDQMYRPSLQYSTTKLQQILHSLLYQRAMMKDFTYVESLIPDVMGNIRPTRSDILAFDIQRGRDHGLERYYKYVEVCNNIEIKSWQDLKQFINKENFHKIRSAYSNWTDIDLIVGGISEEPLHGVCGPTFACIIGEQFSKIRQQQHWMVSSTAQNLLEPYKSMTAARLLCSLFELKYVPNNIFRITSDSNPLMPCSEE